MITHSEIGTVNALASHGPYGSEIKEWLSQLGVRESPEIEVKLLIGLSVFYKLTWEEVHLQAQLIVAKRLHSYFLLATYMSSHSCNWLSFLQEGS